MNPIGVIAQALVQATAHHTACCDHSTGNQCRRWTPSRRRNCFRYLPESKSRSTTTSQDNSCDMEVVGSLP
jgi:hypothetical protein